MRKLLLALLLVTALGGCTTLGDRTLQRPAPDSRNAIPTRIASRTTPAETPADAPR